MKTNYVHRLRFNPPVRPEGRRIYTNTGWFVVLRRPAGHLRRLAPLTERGHQSDDDDEDEDGQADGDPNFFLQRDDRHRDVSVNKDRRQINVSMCSSGRPRPVSKPATSI